MVVATNVQGSAKEVRVTIARTVKSGHLHEIPGGLVGRYSHAEDVIFDADNPKEVVLHLCEKLKVKAPSAQVHAPGAIVGFNFVTQLADVAGTNPMGRTFRGKVDGEEYVIVHMNSSGNPVA